MRLIDFICHSPYLGIPLALISFIIGETILLIGEKEERIMVKKILRIFYIKWIKGECRHICWHCKFGENCIPYFDE